MDFRAQPDDWRSQLEPDSRLRIVNNITYTLKKNFAFSGLELHELEQLAARIEETSYGAATTQSGYLREISLKMLALEPESYDEPIPQLLVHSHTSSTSEYCFESAPQELLHNWRSLLQPDSRYRIVNKIWETLKTVLPFTDEERGLSEIRRIAGKFEEKTYNSATSQTDYLRQISLKMLTMETKRQN
uniref:Mediator complex subunit 15 KIX domain-containing protein n=1 Tax=Kalanchoe fedtschenkoi TaxID=63787 RepID=A0A7N0TVC3_KALFE